MNVSSANIALTILKNDQASLSTPAKAVDDAVAASKAQAAPSSNDRYVPGSDEPPEVAMAVAQLDRLYEVHEGLLNGSISPFDPKASEATGHEKVMNPAKTDSRMVFEGNFISAGDSVPHGTTAPQSDANFLSRRDAMANAYHYATDLMARAARTADTAKSHPDVNLGGSQASISANTVIPHTSEVDVLNMERSAVTLAGMFSFDSASVTAAAYQGKFEGFSLTHGTLGKIMDVSAEGEITLYGSDGTAYSAADYNAANVDGGIPQLHNDMIRKADKDERQAKLQALIDASKQASMSRSATA
ncbi:hypothetical protein [Paracoccus yeei]|nr:hypothetical protein [Paracoccus yeei]